MLIDGTGILSVAVRRLAPIAWRMGRRNIFIITPDAASSAGGGVYASARQKLKVFRQTGFDVRIVSKNELLHEVNLPVGSFYILQNPLRKTDFSQLLRDDLVDLEIISNEVRFLGVPAVVEAAFRILESFNYRRSSIAIVGAKGNIGHRVLDRLKSESLVPLSIDKGDDISTIAGYDIIISAVGQPKLISRALLHKARLVIDIGFWLDPATREAFGDVDKSCYDMDAAVTPVPGGIGPLQVLTLLERAVGLIDATQVSRWEIK